MRIVCVFAAKMFSERRDFIIRLELFENAHFYSLYSKNAILIRRAKKNGKTPKMKF
jgi:hypothetical protein